MLFSIPKLTDNKLPNRNPIWFLFFAGTDKVSERFKVEVMLGWRPDLVIARRDRVLIPVWAGAQLSWNSDEYFRREFKWRFRSDRKEIALRAKGLRELKRLRPTQ